MKIMFASAPGFGLTLPVIPLIWAARAAGHEVLLATSSEMVTAASQAGLAVVDVFPDRDIWADLMKLVTGGRSAAADDLPEEYRLAQGTGNPFGMFAATMTEGTIAAGRAFGADLLVTTSDHSAGLLAAQALGVPVLEVGNRVSWSNRDVDWRTGGHRVVGEDEVSRYLRGKLGIDGPAETLARIDPRAPSMGGLGAGETFADEIDGVPWWPMQFVPYNGGAAVPAWALKARAQAGERPRIAVTLGTVVPAVAGVSSLTVVIEALGAMDVDVVLAAGRADLSELGELPANVDSVGYLPLSVFLPSCSAIVHHGGSGTTAAPLFYGVPQVVLPSFADNPMSAARVVDRGVGLSHDPTTLSSEVLRELVERVLTEPQFAAAAAEVRAEMASQPSPAAVIDRVGQEMADRARQVGADRDSRETAAG